MKPTKEQFKVYVKIRDSGATNMFDIPQVIFLSTLSKHSLTKENCLYIMENFAELAEEYGVRV